MANVRKVEPYKKPNELQGLRVSLVEGDCRQETIAKALGLNIATYRKIEIQQYAPSKSTLKAICLFFNISERQFWGEEIHYGKDGETGNKKRRKY